jgi:hypothetical protein
MSYDFYMGIIKCTVCGEEFGTYDALNEHVRLETEDKKHNKHQGFNAQ